MQDKNFDFGNSYSQFYCSKMMITWKPQWIERITKTKTLIKPDYFK